MGFIKEAIDFSFWSLILRVQDPLLFLQTAIYDKTRGNGLSPTISYNKSPCDNPKNLVSQVSSTKFSANSPIIFEWAVFY